MDVSPKQLVSVAAGLIPFLEHDDANRALMGSNMQRQAVPLLVTERPYVATGLEDRVARDSRVMVLAEKSGKVAYVSADEIIVSKDGEAADEEDAAKDDYQELRAAQVHALQRGHLLQPEADRAGRARRSRRATCWPTARPPAEGELALGRNVLVAFMPWCGYNFEDAILISEKLVREDVFTSIHIEEFECGARDTKLGPEEITRDIPNVGEEALKNLGHDGVIRVGAEVKPGDILVGKITPKSETELAPEERLLRAIFGEKAADVRDTSLTVPSGTYGIVMDVKVSAHKDVQRTKLTPAERDASSSRRSRTSTRPSSEQLTEELTEALSNILLGEKIPLDVVEHGDRRGHHPGQPQDHEDAAAQAGGGVRPHRDRPQPDPDQDREHHRRVHAASSPSSRWSRSARMDRLESGDDVDPGIIKQVKVYVASKKKLSVGDKMAGRHGNKGVIARIVPEEDMPFLPDGTPVEIVLNPLGVPSRMNVGQVLETHLGWACKVPGHARGDAGLRRDLREAASASCSTKAGLPADGKTRAVRRPHRRAVRPAVVVGYIYMMKLHHLVSDKIHARAVGPYSLVTQQPLGGKAQYGGQRFGEMEVWALEAYGAAYALQELLTVKSDDVPGRTRIYESIVKGENTLEAGMPESFNVLMKEMQSLALDVQVNRSEGHERADLRALARQETND